MMRIMDATWFSPMGMTGILGIIYGQDEITGKKKAYIGTAPGSDEGSDAEYIVDTGAKFTREQANHLLGFLMLPDKKE